MDPRIWSRLPADLLEHVLSFSAIKHLPEPQINLQTLQISHLFSCFHLQTFFFFFFFKILFFSAAFAPTDSRKLLPLRHYPQHLAQPIPPPPSLAILCTLFLLALHLLRPRLFLLPNALFPRLQPLGRNFRTVNFPKYPFPFSFDSLTLISTSTGFKLFVLRSSSGSSTNAFVYDSGLDLWVHLNQIDSVLGDNYNYHRQAVVNCNGFLYFTTQEPPFNRWVLFGNRETGEIGCEFTGWRSA